MNLVSTLELYAGGPGSGCTGPNCGRKPTLLEKPTLFEDIDPYYADLLKKGEKKEPKSKAENAFTRWASESEEAFSREKRRLNNAIKEGTAHPFLPLMHSIKDTLYRGLSVNKSNMLATAQVGDTIKLGATSFSKSKSQASSFAVPFTKDIRLLMQVTGGVKKGLYIPDYVNSKDHNIEPDKLKEKEVVAFGKFKVLAVRDTKFDRWPGRILTLRSI